MGESISLKMDEKFAASLNMGKNLCCIMSYKQHKLYKNDQKMMECK